MNVCLLLTGCIRPNITNDMLAISDTETRKRQYAEAINWYKKNTPYNIVFCENSGTDISASIDNDHVYSGQVEILTYIKRGGEDRSKGYKEMEILEYIYENSKLFKKADICVKITGRLILLNIISLVNHLGNIKHDFISAYMYGRRKFCDSRFLFFTPKFLPILLEKKEQIYDWKHNFETVTFEAIFEAKKHNIQFIYPPHAERVHGVGGGFGIIYDVNDIMYFKLDMKHQLKRLLFKFKILPKIKE